MKRLIITALIAATAMTGPAAAELSRDGRNRLIVGATILGLLALGAQERQTPRAVQPVQPYQPPTQAGWLPGACVSRYSLSGGPLHFVHAGCLEQTWGNTNALPLDCALTIRVNGRYESGFDQACLGAYGYRLSSY